MNTVRKTAPTDHCNEDHSIFVEDPILTPDLATHVVTLQAIHSAVSKSPQNCLQSTDFEGFKIIAVRTIKNFLLLKFRTVDDKESNVCEGFHV